LNESVEQARHQGDIDGPEALASLVRLIADRSADTVGHRTKVCILLGAGADLNSGGLTFAELKRQAVEEFSKRRLFDVTLPEQIEARFEDLFLRLQPDERALLIEWIFHRTHTLEPSDAYKVLVLLAEAGGIDAVVTTNFDLMLETAQAQLGRDLFQIFAPGIARPYLLFSHSRFELPKKPYLKLHGDLASRSVTLLTQEDLEHAKYDDSMLQLLRSILQTHDLVLVGYSGFDRALAEIIGESAGTTSNRIYWCNPRPPVTESPLYSRIGGRLRIVRLGFEDLMAEIGRPVLERPSLTRTEPMYLRCLFDWRVEYCNREYVHMYAERSGRSLVDVFARRRLLENRLQSFLLPNRPLAIITGPSGFGKTTLGIRLYKTWRSDPATRIMLIRSKALHNGGDIEQYVDERLAGLGSRIPFSLFQLERWIRDNGMRLVLFIDGVNEFSTDLIRCIQFFRNILRLCYFLPEADSALRVIATIRQETWNAMLPHIDNEQLRQTVWVEGDAQQSFSTIAVNALTDEELSDAITRLRNHGLASIDTGHLASTEKDQLRDPYLLGVIAESASKGLPTTLGAGIYRRVLESKLQRRNSVIDTATLKEILASVALKTLSSQQDRFREVDIQPASLRGEVVRMMKDLHVFVDADDGFIQFDHDRTLEYFLALGLASVGDPNLETIEDLLQFLKHFKGQSKPIAAARLYFQLNPVERFPLISTSLRLLDGPDIRFDSAERELLFGFAREVLVQMTEQREGLTIEYLEDAIDAARSGAVGPIQLRTVVQSAASIPVLSAVPLLTKVSTPTSSLAQTEANIYATDKLVKQFLLSGCPPTDLLKDEPYATFFADASISPWSRLGRLLGFAAQLGPDNSHPQEYASIRNVLDLALNELIRELNWKQNDAEKFAEFFVGNSDRLLFNATPDQIKEFFENPGRGNLEKILDKLAAGAVLTEHDMLTIEPYTTSLRFNVEYNISHVLGVLSSFNNLDETLKLMETQFRRISNDTSPNKAEFFFALLVYINILHNLPYDEERFGWWEEAVLRDWPNILLYRPGLERGEMRGFQDQFDRVFEDGFSVIFPYGLLLPSLRRRCLRYEEYRRALAAETSTQLPLYSKYLEEFLRNDRIEEALQVLQALAGVIVAWPVEGLLTLRSVIGYPEPRVRRATIRILAESFNRYPEETMQFLRTSGAPVSEEDLIDIKIRHDARIGRRQVDEREWARTLHFLMGRPDARDALVASLRIVLRAKTFKDAVFEILQLLGFIKAAGR
jgi:hypothetical protein